MKNVKINWGHGYHVYLNNAELDKQCFRIYVVQITYVVIYVITMF